MEMLVIVRCLDRHKILVKCWIGTGNEFHTSGNGIIVDPDTKTKCCETSLTPQSPLLLILNWHQCHLFHYH